MKRILLSLLAVLLILACSTAQKLVATPTQTPPTLTPTLTYTPAPTETPTLTPTPEFACPNAPDTQLQVGDLARVTEGDPAVNLRKEPVVVPETILTLLGEGRELEITDGPKCVPIPDSEAFYVMWKVSVPGNQPPLDVGWVAEGNAEGYFIEPIPTPEP